MCPVQATPWWHNRTLLSCKSVTGRTCLCVVSLLVCFVYSLSRITYTMYQERMFAPFLTSCAYTLTSSQQAPPATHAQHVSVAHPSPTSLADVAEALSNVSAHTTQAQWRVAVTLGCEGSWVRLSCEGGALLILRAVYGRQSAEVCSSTPPDSSSVDKWAKEWHKHYAQETPDLHDCMCDVTGDVRALCEGRPSCSFLSCTDTFSCGDPVPQVAKYSTVWHTCVTPRLLLAQTTVTWSAVDAVERAVSTALQAQWHNNQTVVLMQNITIDSRQAEGSERPWGTYDQVDVREPVVQETEYSDTIDGTTYHPISFCIPDSKIRSRVHHNKTQLLSSVVPSFTQSYTHATEQQYYDQYARSIFAITHRKGGWDTLRHYEILANGCLPLFVDIDMCPAHTLTALPKIALRHVLGLRGLYVSPFSGRDRHLRTVSPAPMCGVCTRSSGVLNASVQLSDMAAERHSHLQTHTLATVYGELRVTVDPRAFNFTYAQDLSQRLLDYTRTHLSCSALARRALKVTHVVVPDPKAKDATPLKTRVQVLYLSPGATSEDAQHMRDLLLIGLATLQQGGHVCVTDWVKPEYLYLHGPTGAYGRGFTYSQVLPDDNVQGCSVERNPSIIRERLLQRFYDVVIYACAGCTRVGVFPFHADVLHAGYAQHQVLYVNGEDPGGKLHLGNRGLALMREWSADRPTHTGSSAPEPWEVTPPRDPV